MRRSAKTFFWLVAWFCLGGSRATAQRFEVIAIDDTSVGAEMIATAIDDASTIVGYAEVIPGSLGDIRTFVARPGIAPVSFDALVPSAAGLAGNNAIYGLNNVGWGVGQMDVPGAMSAHAALFTSLGIYDLGTLPGDVLSRANDVNDAGVIVGSSLGTRSRPVVWYQGVMAEMPAGGTNATMTAVNNTGLIVGQSDGRPFAWYNWRAYDLMPMMSPSPFRLLSCHAVDVNDAWTALFRCSFADGPFSTRSYLVSGGRFEDVGDIGGDTVSLTAINERGCAVGDATRPDGRRVAVFYCDHALVDLSRVIGSSGFSVDVAVDINNRNEIIGRGGPDSDPTRRKPILLRPIAPST